jgi:FG-GAP-like repeat/Bacterial Ig-like domain (group 3)
MRHRLVFSLLFLSFLVSTIHANASGFQSVTSLNAGASPRVVLTGDFNADGKADVVAVNNPGGGATGTIVTRLGNGDATFQSAIVSLSTDSLVAAAQGDFNKDGKQDIIVVDQQLQRAVLMLGDGSGAFTSSGTNNTCSVGPNPTGVVAADLNNDGKLDIAIVNQGTTGVAGAVTVCMGNGNGTFGSPSSYQAADLGLVPTPDPVAIAAGDLNNDGKIDLVVALNSNAYSTLRGNGNGTFQLPSTQILVNLTNPRAVTIADMNKDGNADIVVTTSDVSVLLGNGDLTFRSPASYSVSGWLNSVAVADLNGDGQPDVIIPNTAENEICVLLNKGSGQLGPVMRYAVETAPYSIAVADLNSDHSADVMVANNGIAGVGGTVTVAFGNGDGSLRAAYSYATNPPGISSQSRAVVTGDFNNDGRADIASLLWDSVSVLIADSNHAFERLGTYIANSSDPGISLAAGDLNADGNLDLAVSGLSQIDVLLGKGDGTFQTPIVQTIPSGLTHGIVLADVNLDGKVDLIYTWASAAQNDIAVCFGKGDGTFQSPVLYTVGNYPYSVIAVDLNNDQKLDLVTANASGTVAYLKNNGDGTFAAAQQLVTGGYTTGVTAVDVNHDGTLDLVAMNSGNGDPTKAGLSFFLGHGDGSFNSAVQRATGTLLNSIVSGDFRNVGNGDVAVAGGQTVFVFWGTQDGSVPSTPSTFSGGAAPWSIAAEDLMGGGSSDIVIGQGDDRVVLLANLGGTRAALMPSVNPSVVNNPVAFTAQFLPVLPWVGIPTGNVNYTEGTELLGTASLSSAAEATLPVSFTTLGGHEVTAAYSGDGTFNPRSVSILQQVNAIPPDYTVSSMQTTASVRAGQAATYTLAVAGLGGFNTAISFSCSGLPLNSACSFAPSSVTPSGSEPVTTVLTVQTAGTAAMLKTMPAHRRSMVLAFSLSFGLAGLLLVGGGPNRRLWVGLLGCGIISLVLLTGCGGGGGSGGGSTAPPPGPITPTGSSTITVTATGTMNGVTISHQIPVTLVVNP